MAKKTKTPAKVSETLFENVPIDSPQIVPAGTKTTKKIKKVSDRLKDATETANASEKQFAARAAQVQTVDLTPQVLDAELKAYADNLAKARGVDPRKLGELLAADPKVMELQEKVAQAARTKDRTLLMEAEKLRDELFGAGQRFVESSEAEALTSKTPAFLKEHLLSRGVSAEDADITIDILRSQHGTTKNGRIPMTKENWEAMTEAAEQVRKTKAADQAKLIADAISGKKKPPPETVAAAESGAQAFAESTKSIKTSDLMAEAMKSAGLSEGHLSPAQRAAIQETIAGFGSAEVPAATADQIAAGLGASGANQASKSPLAKLLRSKISEKESLSRTVDTLHEKALIENSERTRKISSLVESARQQAVPAIEARQALLLDQITGRSADAARATRAEEAMARIRAAQSAEFASRIGPDTAMTAEEIVADQSNLRRMLAGAAKSSYEGVSALPKAELVPTIGQRLSGVAGKLGMVGGIAKVGGEIAAMELGSTVVGGLMDQMIGVPGAAEAGREYRSHIEDSQRMNSVVQQQFAAPLTQLKQQEAAMQMQAAQRKQMGLASGDSLL